MENSDSHHELLNCEAVLNVLRTHQQDLLARGVKHIGVFGSVARGDADLNSDINILIELDTNSTIDLYSYVALKEYIRNFFQRDVDVINRRAIKRPLRSSVENGTIYAF